METLWSNRTLTLLALAVIATWCVLFVDGLVSRDDDALTSRGLELLAESKAADLGWLAAEEAGENLATVRQLAEDAVAESPVPASQRPALARAAALLAVAGDLEAGARIAAAADYPAVASFLRRAAVPDAEGTLLDAHEIDAAIESLRLGRWLCARLVFVLAERVGSPEALAAARATLGGAQRGQLRRVSAVAAAVLLGGLAGLCLLLVAGWRLRVWLRRAERRPFVFLGGLRTAVAVCLVWFLAHVASGVAAVLPTFAGVELTLGTLILLQTSLSGLATWWLLREFALLRGVPVAAAVRLDRAPGRHALAWGLGATAVALPLVTAAGLLGSWLLGPERLHPAIAHLAAGPSRLSVALLVVAVCGVAPLFEELLYRGYLYPALRERWGVWPAALVSGAAFAVCHVSPTAFLGLCALGVVLALAREATGSLWPAVLCHALWNLVSLAYVWLLVD